MAHNCPNCSQPLDGFTTEDKVRERLKAKTEEIGELRNELKTARSSASSAEAYLRERDEARTELTEFREKATRSSALRSIGVDTGNETGAKAEKSFLALYRSEIAGLETGERPSFEDWLQAEDGARANPLLDRFFVGDASGDASGDSSTMAERQRSATTNGVGSKRGLFAKERGTAQINEAGRRQLSPGELRQHLQNMTPKEAKAWIDANAQDYGSSPSS